MMREESEDIASPIESTIWRLYAAERDYEHRSALLANALATTPPADRWALLTALLSDALCTIDGLMVEHPKRDQLRVIFESKADLAELLESHI